jgi:flagellar hook assembly protein FlgD
VFALAQPGEASVRIYDLAGRSVRTLASGLMLAGSKTLRWDRRDATGLVAPPGLYFCVVRANSLMAVRRIVLVQ